MPCVTATTHNKGYAQKITGISLSHLMEISTEA